MALLDLLAFYRHICPLCHFSVITVVRRLEMSCDTLSSIQKAIIIVDDHRLSFSFRGRRQLSHHFIIIIVVDVVDLSTRTIISLTAVDTVAARDESSR